MYVFVFAEAIFHLTFKKTRTIVCVLVLDMTFELINLILTFHYAIMSTWISEVDLFDMHE